MKLIFGILVLFVGVSASAENCELISGSFKTSIVQCQHSRDGVNFYPDGNKEIRIDFNEVSSDLKIDMVSNNYTLRYLADGYEHAGRPQFEGKRYTAQCKNNQIHIRGIYSELKYPLLTNIGIDEEGHLIYKQTFDGSSSIRICEMDRAL